MAELKDFHTVEGDLLVKGRVVAEKFEGTTGGSAAETDWERAVKQHLNHDAENDEIVINEHLKVENDIETENDIVVGRDLCIDSLQNIQDPNGEPFIPDPSGHINEVLTHITTGYTWKKGYELKGFQVVKKSVFENSFVYQTHIVYFVWNDTTGDHYGEVYVRYYEA